MTCKIPNAALNQHLAILGKTGSGKTYAAKGVVEHLLDHKKQVCVLDPTGAWWGLRLAANGKDKGYPVVILGGKHGDIPLAEQSGAAVARLVTQQRASVVIDTTGFTVGEYTRWFIDFAGTLYTTIHSPLHLVIDEAHNFMPQGKSPDVDAGRMLHAGNRLMSGGRSLGIRGLLLTQRPAKLHKDSLTCADTLIAMRMIAPQDRQAVKDWIDGAGDQAKGREVLDSLASLQKGEGWVWYPEGGHLERVRFPKIKTYDSSATPNDDGKDAPALGTINLDDLKASMAEAIKEAEANDPKHLRKQIADLRAELAKAGRGAAPKVVVQTDQKAVERAVADRDRFWKVEASKWQKAAVLLTANMAKIAGLTRANGELPTPSDPTPTPAITASAVMAAVPVRRDTPAAAVPLDGLSKAQERIIEAMTWLRSIGQNRPSSKAVGLLAGIDPTGGYFSNTIGPLCSRGLVDRSNGEVALTSSALASLTIPNDITLEDYHGRIRRTLGQCRTGKTAEMFDALVANGPGEMSSESLGQAVGVDHTGGYFSNNVGPLATLGLIERSRGQIRTTSIMFPEGLV